MVRVFAPTANLLTRQKKVVMKMEFGSDLRTMRKRAGMSQEDVALELHMSISNISRLETNKYELKAADLARWAHATNSMDLLVALLSGIDILVVQQILETTTTLIGTILLGGFI